MFKLFTEIPEMKQRQKNQRKKTGAFPKSYTEEDRENAARINLRNRKIFEENQGRQITNVCPSLHI